MMRILLPFLIACSAQTVDFAEDCDVRIHEVTPGEGPVGTEVSARLTPVTTIWDTAVYANDERAEVSEIRRDNCEACDQCTEEVGCLSCNDCDDCDAICRDECVESVVFTIPEIAPGAVQIVVYNGHGGSNVESFLVTAELDTGTTPLDTGTADSGSAVDSSTPEATYRPSPSTDDIGPYRKEP